MVPGLSYWILNLSWNLDLDLKKCWQKIHGKSFPMVPCHDHGTIFSNGKVSVCCKEIKGHKLKGISRLVLNFLCTFLHISCWTAVPFGGPLLKCCDSKVRLDLCRILLISHTNLYQLVILIWVRRDIWCVLYHLSLSCLFVLNRQSFWQ